MRVGREQIFGIAEAIAMAGADPQAWSQVAERLQAVAPASGFSLLVHSSSDAPDLVAAATGYDPNFLKSYVDHYHAMNPYPELLKHAPTGKVLRPSDMIDTDWQKRHPFFHEWLLPAGNYTRGASLTATREKGGFVRLCFDIPDQHVRSEDAAAGVLAQLGGHAQRALELNSRLADARLRTVIAGSMIEAMACATFVINGRCRVVSMNAKAQALVHDTTALRLDVYGRLSFVLANDQDRLTGSLGGMVTPGASTRDFIVRLNGRRHLASIIPIPGGAGLVPATTIASALVANLAVLMLVDLDAESIAPSRKVLQGLFHLTSAEANVILALAEGLDTKEIAERLGVKLSTARNQLAAAMGKLGVRRQAEVLLLLARISPRLRSAE